jgi:hypothetical protein
LGAIREGKVEDGKEKGIGGGRFPKEGKGIRTPNMAEQFGVKPEPVLSTGGSKQLLTLPSSQLESLGGGGGYPKLAVWERKLGQQVPQDSQRGQGAGPSLDREP